MNLELAIKKASLTLKNHNIVSHELDAQILLSNIMGIEREFLITNNQINISEKIKKKYEIAIERRVKREPIAYIIGKKEFWSESFKVNQSTLIPRPETELLIYKVINFFRNKKISILDIGTGTGCILLSILKELSSSRGLGIDISAKAIEIAKINSNNLNLSSRAKFKVFDLNKFNTGKYDLIVSNPPYIPSGDIRNLSKDITNYEPLAALNGGSDGLDLIIKVIYKSDHLLKREGLLALEIGHNQYQRVSSILKRNGYREMTKVYDYKRNVRCIIGTKIKFFKSKK
ncbi:MAG: peptide chain release factor N(5)-glutamine methyltransferase [Candidatus Pelagibacterales bacterium]|nr:MAG: peptide chain release factor N(5)-glutamine methyltransferase [Pelagibacterales bacterium]